MYLPVPLRQCVTWIQTCAVLATQRQHTTPTTTAHRPTFVRPCVRACVRSFVRSCVRSCVRSFVRSFSFLLCWLRHFLALLLSRVTRKHTRHTAHGVCQHISCGARAGGSWRGVCGCVQTSSCRTRRVCCNHEKWVWAQQTATVLVWGRQGSCREKREASAVRCGQHCLFVDPP